MERKRSRLHLLPLLMHHKRYTPLDDDALSIGMRSIGVKYIFKILPDTENVPVYWTELSRFHLKTETEFNLLNAVL
jgi:hypothetical protein